LGGGSATDSAIVDDGPVHDDSFFDDSCLFGDF
jgi:hypothetical protein